MDAVRGKRVSSDNGNCGFEEESNGENGEWMGKIDKESRAIAFGKLFPMDFRVYFVKRNRLRISRRTERQSASLEASILVTRETDTMSFR